MIRIRGLQQRLAIFLLLPVSLLLCAMITAGFYYTRDQLLEQWREVSILRLERSAHFVDMRLSHPKEWLQVFSYATGDTASSSLIDHLAERLRGMEGIADVEVTWFDEASPPAPAHNAGELETPMLPSLDGRGRGRVETSGIQHPHPTSPVEGEELDSPALAPAHRDGQHGPPQRKMGMEAGRGRMHFKRVVPIEITAPQYDAVTDHETVSLIASLAGEEGKIIGRIKVAIAFDYLVEDLRSSKLWQEHRIFLVDDTGKVLMCADPRERKQLGSSGNPLELATLKALQRQPFGTLLGPGHPPEEVSGFFRLREAPWTLVVLAPGREVLAPIIRFRFHFLVGGAAFIIFILALMRWVTGRTVSSIKAVAKAADNIARGTHTPLLPSKTHDEVGQLIESFNTMAEQLEERIRLKEALDLAMEVQQGLLPKEAPKAEGLDIAGKCIYCDETGGDYYDFLEFSELDGRIGVVVGDVAGHGIGAALIMATVRSLLRSRLTQPGTLSQVITDVNRLLCLDTSQTASFMTLFFMLADRVNEKINWVRAGHDPAIIYDFSTDSFSELRGTGVALGVDETLSFHEYEYPGWTGGQIIVVGTDGIWETTDDRGEMYGKERLLDLIRTHRSRPAEEIVQTITDALVQFRRTAPQQDDITLVVVKTEPLLC